jgi:DNA mismatch endonuclease, patch repair protein
MRAVRRTGTKPETVVQELVRRLGIRFQVGASSLPGSPDLANRRAGWAVFVHGCFWHGHQGCALATIPKTNSDFWTTKIEANRLRDRRKARELRAMGFAVVTIWQCETRDPERLAARLGRVLPR